MRFFAIISVFFFSLTLLNAQKLDSLKSAISYAESDSSKVEIYLAIHDILKLSDFTLASKYIDSAYSLAKKSDWKLGIAKTGQFHGAALSLTGRPDEAKEVLSEVTEIAEQLGEVSINAYSEMTLGNIEYDQSNYAKALPHYYASQKLYESIDNYAGASAALIWVGIINQFGLKDYDKAIEVYAVASELARKGNSTLNQSYIFTNLATIYYERDEYDSAISYIKKSNVIKEQFGDKRGLANGIEALGNNYYDLGDLDRARDYYEQSLAMRKELADSTGIASAYINVGRVYGDQGLTNKAFDSFNKGREIAESIGFKEAVQQAYLVESGFLEKSSRYKEALAKFKSYKTVSDSMYNIDSRKVLEELQIQYETEKKEQQIELQEAQLSEQALKIQRNRLLTIALTLIAILFLAVIFLVRNRARKNQKLLLQESQLKLREAEINAVINSQEKERNRFARDLHDGFGQMISVLKLNLAQLKETGSRDIEKRNEVFKNGEAVINDMYGELRNICFDLMPQTLVKKGLGPALMEFGNRINQSTNVVCEVMIFDEGVRMKEVLEVSLFRITQEWVNNVLKYSGADHITIQFTREASEATLTIEDNGKGFDPENFYEGKGNGWKNIQSRLNQVQGDFDLDSQEARNGTMATVNIDHLEVVESQREEMQPELL